MQGVVVLVSLAPDVRQVVFLKSLNIKIAFILVNLKKGEDKVSGFAQRVSHIQRISFFLQGIFWRSGK